MKSHGMRYTPEYNIWRGIKKRSFNPNDKSYNDYGGRGITMCNGWKNSFEQFYTDMGPKPKGCSIDRIDNNGNYCKENCRWATRSEQNRNKRNNRLIVHKDEVKTIVEWSEIYNISIDALVKRLDELGWSVEDALTTPVDRKLHIFKHDGKTQTLYKWAKEYKIGYDTLRHRVITMKIPLSDALNIPVGNKYVYDYIANKN